MGSKFDAVFFRKLHEGVNIARERTAVFPAFSINVPQMVTGDASGYTKSTRQRGLFVPFPPFTRLPVRIGKA